MPDGLDDPRILRLASALQRRERFRGRFARAAATVACAVRPVRDRVPGLAELPRLAVTCSRSPAGDRMTAKYSGTRHGVPRRLAVSVLAIPSDVERYTRGRSRQALRTNSRHAREAGVTCRLLTLGESGSRLAALLTARGEDALQVGVAHDLASGLCQVWLAEATDGTTEAVAITTRDGDLARLDLMLSAPDRESSPARYLLSAHVVTALGEAGARHLAVDSALFLHPGLRHFQQRLGFAPMTLEVQRGERVHHDALPTPRSPLSRVATPVGAGR